LLFESSEQLQVLRLHLKLLNFTISSSGKIIWFILLGEMSNASE
jgi:hypothetical protein